MGTGGINIDDCRICERTGIMATNLEEDGYAKNDVYGNTKNRKIDYNQGRFPANVILDEEAGKILDEQSGIRPSGKGNGNAKVGVATNGQGVPPLRRGKLVPRNDTGGASRFFYCAKASKKERGEGNNHPTVKPLSLIKYLITLVTPPEGICLDPFEGKEHMLCL